MKSDSNGEASTLTRSSVEAIKQYIYSNKLRVGDQLPSESEFCKMLEVSRTVMREAFKILEATRIIESGSGRRARVASVDGVNLYNIVNHGVRTEQFTMLQIWDMRGVIETRSVELACVHRTEQEADQLLELAKEMGKCEQDIERLMDLDIEFHNTLASFSRNPLCSAMVGSLTSLMRETTPIVWRSRDKNVSHERILNWHHEIATAVKDRDVDKAISAMSDHFEAASLDLVRSGLSYLGT